MQPLRFAIAGAVPATSYYVPISGRTFLLTKSRIQEYNFFMSCRRDEKGSVKTESDCANCATRLRALYVGMAKHRRLYLFRFPTAKNTVSNVRTVIMQHINQIKQLPNENHRMILICSLVDSFAQHVSNYALHNNADHFADFLVKYSKEHANILSAICPSTLFYHAQKDLPDNAILTFGEDETVFADDQVAVNEVHRIISLLPTSKQQTYAKKHRYAQLIYAMRNKLVHEMIVVGCEVSFITEDSDPIPHMIYGVSGYPECWLLHIPEKLVFDVAESAISNYLDECEKEQRNPFQNNDIGRLCYKSWYEK